MDKKAFYLLCRPEWHYELSTLIRQVYPFAKIEAEPQPDMDGIRIAEDGCAAVLYDASGQLRKRVQREERFAFPGEPEKNYAKQALYELLADPQPWGILTGVRASPRWYMLFWRPGAVRRRLRKF